MIFTVMWRQQAIEELARVWMATADRPRLSDAVSRIDADREKGVRTLFHEPGSLPRCTLANVHQPH